MNPCWAVIPVKDLDRAKSRLGADLSPAERVCLSLEMLSRVLSAASDVAGLNVIVVSSDRRALELAGGVSVRTLEDRWNGLNPSLEAAARWCIERGARSLLVLHADLPLIESDDIQSMMELGVSAPSVVLAPCRRGEGTNALLMRPPGAIPFAFGPGSFRAHRELASRHGVALAIYRSPTIALDLDTWEDLELFRSQVPLPEGARH